MGAGEGWDLELEVGNGVVGGCILLEVGMPQGLDRAKHVNRTSTPESRYTTKQSDSDSNISAEF